MAQTVPYYEYQSAYNNTPTYTDTVRTTLSPSSTIYVPEYDQSSQQNKSDDDNGSLRSMLTSAGN
jgi:hypothetical protein